jgi:hypothetical protein
MCDLRYGERSSSIPEKFPHGSKEKDRGQQRQQGRIWIWSAAVSAALVFSFKRNNKAMETAALQIETSGPFRY